ncbi:MAG: hypothetical protein JKY65_10650 [Planctomycetes bacterium]|nr:hypothetical protein [Planctomycetota bacterium]
MREAPVFQALVMGGALAVGLLLFLATQVDLGASALALVVGLTAAFFVLLYVVMDRVPTGTLRAAEIGTTVFLALIGGVLGGGLALILLEVLSVSSGVSEAVADSIRGAAKGRAIRRDWVVFLSVAGSVTIWIGLLRARRFAEAKSRGLNEAMRHSPDRVRDQGAPSAESSGDEEASEG